jgi:hypothetical protein
MVPVNKVKFAELEELLISTSYTYEAPESIDPRDAGILQVTVAALAFTDADALAINAAESPLEEAITKSPV